MLIRRELPGDAGGIADVHAAAFDRGDGGTPGEVALVESLRTCGAWRAELSWVAVDDGRIVGHVVATVAHVGDEPVVGLGPLGVHPEVQGTGVGSALMYSVLGAADALDVPLVGLLGSPAYYGRFGFVPAAGLGIEAPDPAWGDHFQVRTLTADRPTIRGPFRYAPPF